MPYMLCASQYGQCALVCIALAVLVCVDRRVMSAEGSCEVHSLLLGFRRCSVCILFVLIYGKDGLLRCVSICCICGGVYRWCL